MTEKPKSRRGFAAMDPEKRRAIAASGGGSVPAAKRSFSKDSALAREAGRKGGQSSTGGGKTRRVFGPGTFLGPPEPDDDD